MSQKPVIPQKNQASATSATRSLGYPLIEELLNSENFDRLNKSFAEGYQKLEKIMLDRGVGIKKQKDARKAMRAYELTSDLIKELLKLKYQLQRDKEKQK